MNLYAYAASNPISFIDPNGKTAASPAIPGCPQAVTSIFSWLAKRIAAAIGIGALTSESGQSGFAYRGLSQRDISTLSSVFMVLPKQVGSTMTLDQHIVLGSGGPAVSMTRSEDIARTYATTGNDPGYMIIKIDLAKLPGPVWNVDRGEGILSPAARELSVESQEILTTVIPGSAIVEYKPALPTDPADSHSVPSEPTEHWNPCRDKKPSCNIPSLDN